MKRELLAVGLLVLSVSAYGQISYQPDMEEDTIKRTTKIQEVELFGVPKKQPKKLEIITRLPLNPRDQIQSISVISEKAIQDMGALTITDAAKNIPGVVLFSKYGGNAESMSIRGYRGTPVLKNGVLMNSDFRTSSMIADVQGIESMQVLRGSAAITQGIGSALGAAGGVINIATKTPKFYNYGNVGFRYGNWNLFRPTLDFERVLDASGSISMRVNAAYQNNESFADHIKGERFYFNPTFAFRPDDKTTIVAEMDYLKDKTTPNRGTVNLSADDENNIYDMPKEKFLGFASDYAKTNALSYGISAERLLNSHFKLRAAFMAMDTEAEGLSTGALRVVGGDYKMRRRTLGKSGGSDHSKVFQADFIGHDIKTGIFKHTFQIGFDWKESFKETKSYGLNGNPNVTGINVDVIDVTQDINNLLPQNINVDALQYLATVISPKSPTIGLMAQEVLGLGEHFKAIMGIRYSKFNGNTQEGQKHAWDPQFGLMFSPLENINLYASYTTTTSLRGNSNLLVNGGTVGPSMTRQWEGGVKSDWFDEKLRFNINLYSMDMNNLSYSVLNEQGNATGYYDFAGDLTRKGIEVDLIGRAFENLEIMAGYAYLDAKYENSPAYVNGSRPMMAAEHTANAWVNYTVRDGALRGLHFGGGAYYVGERPVNEFTQKVIVHNTVPGVKPFMLNAFTTINAQIGYQRGNYGIKFFANNLNDATGYSAYYRGGYLNRNDPRNFAVQLNYKF